MESSFLESLKGFSQLNYEARIRKLEELGFISDKDVTYLKSEKIDLSLSERFIENTLRYFEMPLGVAVNFIVDKEPYVIPMAVEESSIIAASSKTARWICENGFIQTETLSRFSIGQIQIAKVKNFKRLENIIQKRFQHWKREIESQVLSSMVKRGGGLKSYELRSLAHPDGKNEMAVLHLHIQTCDAMGANVINQVCEYLKPILERETQEEVNMCILSNLADKRLTRARVVLKNQDKDLIKKIEEASLFAEVDPYRAATHNKGILNGIDGLLIATGNDWRAVESGLHAYASSKGRYTSLSRWRVKDDELHGVLEGPFMLGTVGGVTELHPTAQLCLKMLKFQSGEKLARICAAVGLVQNLGALKALVTDGVIEGHMKLHVKNIALQTGADSQELSLLEKRLQENLRVNKRISFTQALKTLQNLRKEQDNI